MWARLRSSLGALLKRHRFEERMDQEMQFHLEAFTEDLVKSGVPRREAERRARIEFGGVEIVQESCRESRGIHIFDALRRDTAYAWRVFRRQPGFTLIAVLTLALGIGANTAIFSIVNAVLLRPFAYREPQQLVILLERGSGGGKGYSPSYPNFADWRVQSAAVFDSMSAVHENESFNFTGAGEPERLQGRLVSAEFLATLGVKPALGRDFLAEEDRAGAAQAVLLSYSFWQRRFGGDPSVIGKQLTLNNQSFTVVGITAANFRFGPDVDVTVLIGLQSKRFGTRGRDPGADVVARLKANVSVQQAETEMNVIAARLEQQTNKGQRVRVIPLHESVVGNVRQPLLILLGAVGLVLLIACTNVANLLLVRAAGRGREMAMRVALGASRATLVRQLLTESLLLAALGAGVGILLAFWGTSFIAAKLPDGIPRLQEAQVDGPVLAIMLAVSLVAGLLFGLVPALQSSRPNLTEGLKEGERGSSGSRQRLRSVLVVSEIALTLTLLIGAGLLIQSFRRVLQVDPGFKTQNLLTMRVSVSNPDQLQQNVRNLPGVKSVAVADGLPFGSANYPGFSIEGRQIPNDKGSGLRYNVSPDYFRTMGIELIKGRLFTAEDTRESQRVIVINEVLGQRFFSNEDPLGKRLRETPTSPSLEIVGIVRHVEHYKLDAQKGAQPQFYTNFNQNPLPSLPASVIRINLVVRTEVEPLSLAQAVRAQAQAMNKDQAVFNVRTMEKAAAQSVAPRRFSMLLLTAFALVALALASLGIYGVMSYAVVQRTREVGVRMALGAQVGDVLRLVIGQGMKLTLVGVALGLIASLALTRTMETLLFGISPTDPLTFAVIAVTLTLVALLACYIPARLATKIDPLAALRHE